MIKKLPSIFTLIFSIICLLIFMKLTWNLGIYVDEHNCSPADVFGGETNVVLYWLQMVFFVLISILSVINLNDHK